MVANYKLWLKKQQREFLPGGVCGLLSFFFVSKLSHYWVSRVRKTVFLVMFFSVCQSITHSPSLAAWSSGVIFLFSCCSPAHMSLYYRRQSSINRFVMVFRRILCPLPSFWARRLLVNYFWCQLGLSWPTVFSLQPPILPSALGFLHTKARLVVWGCQNRLRRNYSCYFCMHQPRLSEWCIGFISLSPVCFMLM